MGHSSTSLLDHLVGTHDLLEAWGAEPAVCAGGLFHSVYGTESYQASAVPLDLRPAVRAVLGERAERLAYLFGAMEKATYSESVFRGTDHSVVDRHTGETHPMTPAEFADLSAMVTANWLEQRPRLGPEWQFLKADMFAVLLPLLPPDGARALSDAYGFDSSD